MIMGKFLYFIHSNNKFVSSIKRLEHIRYLNLLFHFYNEPSSHHNYQAHLKKDTFKNYIKNQLNLVTRRVVIVLAQA